MSERYGFIHALYHEVLYARVAARRKARMHHQIGVRMEAGFAQETREIAGELAQHFERAQQAARAIPYLQLAAEKALKGGDAQWCAELCDHLLALDPGEQSLRNLKAASLELLAEKLLTATGRNYYLTVAQELRKPLPSGDGQ